MINRREDAIERALDDWWDGVASGQQVNPDSMLSSVTTITIETLHAEDDAPAPNHNFVYLLRDDLARAAAISAASWPALTAQPADDEVRLERLTVDPKAKPFRLRRGKALLELAAVAVLILGLVSTMFGGSPFAALDLWPRPPSPPVTILREPPDPLGMYRGDAARTGVMQGPGPVGQPVLKWKQPVADDASAADHLTAPVVTGERLFAVEDGVGIVAFDIWTGRILWKKTVGPIAQSEPAADHGQVYVATNGPEMGRSGGGFLIALDASTGREHWRYSTGPYRGTYSSSPALWNNTIYLTPSDGTIRAVDAITGAERWQFTLNEGIGTEPISPDGPNFPSSPAVADGIVYAADDTGRLFALDAETGKELWRYQSKDAFLATPVVADQVVYLSSLVRANDLPTSITSLDAKTGKELKSWSFERNIRFPPVVVGDLVIVAGTGGWNDSVTAINWPKGEIAWTFSTGANVYEPPVFSHGVLYVTNENDEVYALDRDSGTLLWTAIPGVQGVSSPVVAGDKVIVTGRSGRYAAVYAIGGNGDPESLNNLTDISFDISGLPPCMPFRESPEGPIKGMPASKTGFEPGPNTWGTEVTRYQLPVENPARPAMSDEVRVVTLTLHAMANCNRPETRSELPSFYSDDFYRRPGVLYDAQGRPYPNPGVLDEIIGSEGSQVMPVEDVRLLQDGRIGVLFMTDEDIGQFIIFARQGDHWLVDETLQVVPLPGGGMG